MHVVLLRVVHVVHALEGSTTGGYSVYNLLLCFLLEGIEIILFLRDVKLTSCKSCPCKSCPCNTIG